MSAFPSIGAFVTAGRRRVIDARSEAAEFAGFVVRTTRRSQHHGLNDNESYSSSRPKGSGHRIAIIEFEANSPRFVAQEAGAKTQAFMIAAMESRLIMSNSSNHPWVTGGTTRADLMHVFISPTACCSPTNIARLMMLWPMLSSAIFARRATGATFW